MSAYVGSEAFDELARRTAYVRRIITQSQKALEADWKKAILENGFFADVNTPLPFRKVLDEPGGYRISATTIENLGKTAREFYRDNGHKTAGGYATRGYRYYSSDPNMYLPSNCPSNIGLLDKAIERWKSYPSQISILDEALVESRPSVGRWSAAAGWLEWVANDICTFYWLSMSLPSTHRSQDLVDIFEGNLNKISSALVKMVYTAPVLGKVKHPFSLDFVTHDLFDMEPILQLRDIAILLPEINNPGFVRSLREGDQSWLVMATFQNRIMPKLKENPDANVLFVSNAFGGLALGSMWKAAAQDIAGVTSTVKVNAISFYEIEMKRTSTVFDYAANNMRGGQGYDIAFLGDDSIFTGRSMECMEAQVENTTEIIWAPTTFDCAMPTHHPETLGATAEEALQKFDAVLGRVKTTDGFIAAARSYWAYTKRKDLPVQADPNKNYYQKTVHGSDKLLAMLWRRFEPQISL